MEDLKTPRAANRPQVQALDEQGNQAEVESSGDEYKVLVFHTQSGL